MPQVLPWNQEGPSKVEAFYDAIRNVEVGKDLSYDQIRTMTGFDVLSDGRYLIYQANKRLLQDDKKHLQNIKGHGYKMATPQEQMAHASKRRVRASRQTRKGILEASNLDTSKMSQDEKQKQVHLLNHMNTMLSVSRKRSAAGLQETQKARKNIEKAEIFQQEAIQEMDRIRQQLHDLTQKFS